MQQAIESGDTRGLPSQSRAFVQKVRDFMRFAAAFGAEPVAKAGQRPRSIEELLEWAGECGTRSILDIERVAAQPGFSVAAPMTAASLRRVFGTAKPTHTQVEELWADIAERLKRWQARYLPVYLNDEPYEYGFIGCSGD